MNDPGTRIVVTAVVAFASVTSTVFFLLDGKDKQREREREREREQGAIDLIPIPPVVHAVLLILVSAGAHHVAYDTLQSSLAIYAAGLVAFASPYLAAALVSQRSSPPRRPTIARIAGILILGNVVSIGFAQRLAGYLDQRCAYHWRSDGPAVSYTYWCPPPDSLPVIAALLAVVVGWSLLTKRSRTQLLVSAVALGMMIIALFVTEPSSSRELMVYAGTHLVLLPFLSVEGRYVVVVALLALPLVECVVALVRMPPEMVRQGKTPRSDDADADVATSDVDE